MDNNDRLIRIRYALDIKNSDMVKIFKMGGLETSLKEVHKLLIKTDDGYSDEANEDKASESKASESKASEETKKEENIFCSDEIFEMFLNGLITFKRGPKKPAPGEKVTLTKPVKGRSLKDEPVISFQQRVMQSTENINNEMIKKLKIALSLTGDQAVEVFKKAGLTLSKGELGNILRKADHKKFKVCGDKYARNFLKGLSIIYRT